MMACSIFSLLDLEDIMSVWFGTLLYMCPTLHYMRVSFMRDQTDGMEWSETQFPSSCFPWIRDAFEKKSPSNRSEQSRKGACVVVVSIFPLQLSKSGNRTLILRYLKQLLFVAIKSPLASWWIPGMSSNVIWIGCRHVRRVFF